MATTEKTAVLISMAPQTGLMGQYGLRSPKITIGRHPSNDIVLAFDSVSRFHARIERRNGLYVYTDLGSSNGSTLNGVKVTEVVLKDKDELRIGNIPFTFRVPTANTDSSVPNVFEDQLVSLAEESNEFESGSWTAIAVSEFRRASSSAVLTPADEKNADREALLRTSRRLGTLYRLSELLRDIEESAQATIMRQILDLTLESVHGDRAILLTAIDCDKAKFEVSFARHRAGTIPGEKLVISRSVLNQVAREKVAILTRDAMGDDRTALAPMLSAALSRASIAAPILVKKDLFGVIYVDSLRTDRALTEEDLKFVGMVATEVGSAFTQLKLRNEALHKNRLAAMGEAIAGISHNVKNILILSQGGADILSSALDKGDVKQAKEAWKIIQRGIDKIGKLMRDMLDYSSNRPINYERVDINDMICSIAEEIEDKLVENRVALELDLEENLKPRFVDNLGLQRTLMNLLINAVEAMPESGGRITVRTRVDERDCLLLDIEDNGSGIPEDKLEKIFEPFYTTKGTSGTGLGLPMCRKTIEDMGGTLTCKSELGRGTTFSLIIPYYQSPPTHA